MAKYVALCNTTYLAIATVFGLENQELLMQAMLHIARNPECVSALLSQRFSDFPSFYFQFNAFKNIIIDDWKRLSEISQITKFYLAEDKVQKLAEELVVVLSQRPEVLSTDYLSMSFGHWALLILSLTFLYR